MAAKSPPAASSPQPQSRRHEACPSPARQPKRTLYAPRRHNTATPPFHPHTPKPHPKENRRRHNPTLPFHPHTPKPNPKVNRRRRDLSPP